MLGAGEGCSEKESVCLYGQLVKSPLTAFSAVPIVRSSCHAYSGVGCAGLTGIHLQTGVGHGMSIGTVGRG